MIRLLAVLLLVASGVAASQPAPKDSKRGSQCAETYSLDRRTKQPAPSDCSLLARKAGIAHTEVSGGESAPDERFTAAIVYEQADQQIFICTGILLDEQYILTAGHCGCGRNYKITFNQFARRGNETVEAREIDGNPILFDPLACLRGPKPGNDLALIRLKERFELKKEDGTGLDLSRLGYPQFALAADEREQMMPGAGLKIVGFGETETGSIATRMKAFVPVLTPDCFEQPYRLYCSPFLEMILAEREGGRVPRDTCGGDSGGPVFAPMSVTLPECVDGSFDIEREERITQSQDVLVGITSRAAPFTQSLSGGHCGGGGIYTLIGRRSVYAWFDANHVKPQRCLVKMK